MIDFSPKMLGQRTFWVVDTFRRTRVLHGKHMAKRVVVPVNKYKLIARVMEKAADDLSNGWKIMAYPSSPDPLGMCGYLIEDDNMWSDPHGLFLHCVHAAASGLDVRVDSIVTGAR